MSAAFLSACSLAPLRDADAPEPPEERLTLVKHEFTDLAGWKSDNHAKLLGAFLKSCPALPVGRDNELLGTRVVHGTMGDLRKACEAGGRVSPSNRAAVQFFFEQTFQPYLARNGLEETGKFTGYYEAEVRASYEPDGRYRYPIYSRPADLIPVNLGGFDPELKGRRLAGRLVDGKLVPYHTRAQIERGALKGQNLEILWADNLADVFFLHVQGSGRAVLPDGSEIRLAFSGRNGHRYTAIGRELAARGILKLQNVSLDTIRTWLNDNPVAGTDLMQRNKSFIFFRLNPGKGPVGAQNVVLTARRSMAVDPKFIKLGLPVWLQTKDPRDPSGETPLRRGVVAQDAGSAIKGPVRGDLYWGAGVEAELAAGRMNEKGVYYLLLPKP